MADSLLLPYAQQLLACLCGELDNNPDPPANCCMRVGDFVIQDVDLQTGLDKVCCPGTAYVSIGAVFPSSSFPEQDESYTKCQPLQWTAQLTMGVVRCIPHFGTTSGPDCDDWTLAAQHDVNDLNAMMHAVCCWSAAYPRRQFLIQQSAPRMTADCIERMMQVLISVPKCC